MKNSEQVRGGKQRIAVLCPRGSEGGERQLPYIRGGGRIVHKFHHSILRNLHCLFMGYSSKARVTWYDSNIKQEPTFFIFPLSFFSLRNTQKQKRRSMGMDLRSCFIVFTRCRQCHAPVLLRAAEKSGLICLIPN